MHDGATIYNLQLTIWYSTSLLQVTVIKLQNMNCDFKKQQNDILETVFLRKNHLEKKDNSNQINQSDLSK